MAAADETSTTVKSPLELPQPAEQRRSVRGSSVRGKVQFFFYLYSKLTVEVGTKLQNILFFRIRYQAKQPRDK